MANNGNGVEIPISLEVTDISLGNVDLGDIEDKLGKKISGIVKNVEKLISNTDTSKFNKALTTSFNSMEKSYNKLQGAQAKFNESMIKAGESSAEYKAKISEITAEMKHLQGQWNDYNNFMSQSYAISKANKDAGAATEQNLKIIKMYEQEYAEFQSKMQALKANMPNPLDYVSSGSETAISKLTLRYSELLKAIKEIDVAQEQWNTTMKGNKVTDEYKEMAADLAKAEQKLGQLQEKAIKMESLGANDKQWESLIYDTTQLSTHITDLETKMRKLVNTDKAFRDGKGGSAKGQEYMKLTAIISRTQKAMQAINSMKPNTMYTEEYAAQLKELTSLEKKLNSYVDKYEKMQAVGARSMMWQSFIYDVQLLERKIIDTTARLEEMVHTGQAFKLGTGDSGRELAEITSRLRASSSVMSEMQNSSKSTRMNVMGLIRVVSDFSTTASQGINKVINGFRKLASVSKHSGKSTHKSLGLIIKRIAMITFGVGSMLYLIRKLRNEFVKAFQEMAVQIPEVNDDISLFIQSLYQIRGSIATAFQPIVSYIIPWLHQLSGALVTAMNSLGMFFATLTGQGYIYKFTAAQVDYAKSLDKTSSSAKKAQKSLMGFDEINRLNGKNDSDSGAGNGIVPTGTFEKEVLKGMSTLAQLIKEAWADGDFYDVGQYIGEKLLYSLEVADNWITTKGYSKTEKIGKSFATLLNGIIETNKLGTELGVTLADSLNMALVGMDTFLSTTNWISLGQFIADWANASILNFNWSLLGKTLAGVLVAAINTWWKFAGEFDFTVLGQSMATSLNKFFQDLLYIDETGLSSAEKLGQAITNTIRGIIQSLTTLIKETDWSSVGTAIGEIFVNLDWSAITWDFAKLVANFIKGLSDAFANWASTDPLSASIAAMLMSAVAGIKIASLVTGIIGKFAYFTNHGDALMSLGEILKLIANFAKVFAGITSVIAGVATYITNFFAMLKNGFSWLNEILMVLGIALAAVGAILLGAPAAVVAAVAGIIAAVSTLIVVIKDNWNAIWNFLKSAWNVFTTAIMAELTALINGVAAIIGTIVGIIVTIVSTITGIIVTAVTAIVGIVTGILATIKTVINTVLNVIKTIISTIVAVIVAIVTGNSDKVGNIISTGINMIKNFISNGANAIKNIWSTVWSTISSITTKVWNGIASIIKGTINVIIGFVNGMVNAIIKGINNMVGVLNKINIDIPDWMPGIGGKSFGLNLPTVNAVQIPRLAQGGVIPPNNEFMAILGDQRSGTNIEAPLDTIKQAVAEELAEYIDAMMTGFQAVVDAVNDKDFDVTIGDNIIGKAAERYNKRQAFVRGTT